MPKKLAQPDQKTIPLKQIQNRIYLIRGHKVMLDTDLALLYGVETFNLNKAVKRNFDRFPVDFMFQLTKEEIGRLKFQIGMPKPAGPAGAPFLMRLLDRVLRCFLASSAANEQLWSISPS